MDTFRRLDKDNSGKLSRDEFVLGMEKMGLTSDQGHQLFKMVDKDRSGEVELSELLAMRDAVAKRERAKRLEDDDEAGEVVDGTLLQMLRNYVLGFVWQTPPPLVPHDPERTLQRAQRAGDSAADVFKDGPLVVPLSGHIKEVEKAIAFRINRMFTEVEALAATVQLAAIKDQEVALTMRDECKRHADALARYRSFLDQTWAALDGVKMRLAPLVEDEPGEGDWVHFGPANGAYQRVHGATAELIVWVLCFQIALPSAFFLVKLGADWQDEDSSYIDAAAGRGALVLAFTWLRNAVASLHWPEFLGGRRLNVCTGDGCTDDWELDSVDEETEHELGYAAGACAIGIAVVLVLWLLRLMDKILRSNLYLPGFAYLLTDPFTLLPMVTQVCRSWIIFHVYGSLLSSGATGIHAAALIASKQICVNLLLQGYILLDVARVKAPFARMLFALNFVGATLSDIYLRKPGSSTTLEMEQVPPTGTAADGYFGDTAQAALYAIDMATLVLMLKGIFKTFVRPHHCSFIALSQQLPEAMFQGTREWNQKLLKGQRRAEAMEVACVPKCCRKSGEKFKLPPSRRSVRGSARHLDMM
jgi:hypothetical protein